MRLRQAARLLMVIYASAIVASALSLQLLSSRWYLNAAERWQRGRIRFQRFGSFMALLYVVVLLPLELVAAGYFAFELHNAERSRLQALQNQQKLISKQD